MQGDPNLSHLTDALRSTCSLACRADCRENNSHQRSNDRDHNQQFEDCKTRPRGDAESGLAEFLRTATRCLLRLIAKL
jgi:hypothetical protein